MSLVTPFEIQRPAIMRLFAHGVPEADLDAIATEAHAIRRLLDDNPHGRHHRPADRHRRGASL